MGHFLGVERMLNWTPLSTLTSEQLFARAREHAAQAKTLTTAEAREALKLVASRYAAIATRRAWEEMTGTRRYTASNWRVSPSSVASQYQE
jgi:hypothetical protein